MNLKVIRLQRNEKVGELGHTEEEVQLARVLFRKLRFGVAQDAQDFR